MVEHTDFRQRKIDIIAQASGPENIALDIAYTPEEDNAWRIVTEALEPLWNRYAAAEILDARNNFVLPGDRVPQLNEVNRLQKCLSGFEFRAVGGLVAKELFFGALADNTFLSTQFLRNPARPLYTEEPDIIHEVIGHGTLFANSDLAELHRLAGRAMRSVEANPAKQFVADVWWFSGEFGVIRSRKGTKAIGAGLLSSAGELQQFSTEARISTLDINEMGTTNYQIDQFQKRLFAGESIAQVLDIVGGFFATVDDDIVACLLDGVSHES